MPVDNQQSPRAQAPAAAHFDAIVVGAGFGGIRAIYELRKMGLTVKAFEAASDVGGTWYWNRYPGARTDSEAWSYCYSFSEELQDDWVWPERMPTWDHVLNYLRHVVDRFDLRKDIQFNTRVTSLSYDEAANRWTAEIDSGARFTCDYLISAMGILTVPITPPFKGFETFKGEKYLSCRWPHEPVSFEGKRVAVIGSGATAVQILPIVAQTAAHVTMFQRTPNYVMPGRNHPIDPSQRAGLKANREHLWKLIRQQVFAFPFEPVNRLYSDTPPEKREAIFDAGWEDGGFRFVFGTFDDLLVNPEANEAAAAFIRKKIRAIVKNPETAERLCPDYAFGIKRPPLGNFYFEAFNRPNVSLVDVSKNPITEITETGLRAGTEHYDFDMLIFALGFDAVTGSLTNMDVTGRDVQTMKARWQYGPKTQLGVMVDGFPNFFMISGPHTPFSNFPPAIEAEVEWIGAAIRTLREDGHATMEPTRDAVEAWGKHIQEMLDMTLLGAGTKVHTWYLGANMPGKTPSVLFYFGGAGAYFQELQASIDEGFPGFAFNDAAGTAKGRRKTGTAQVGADV